MSGEKLKIEIDWKLVASKLQKGCSGQGIADFLGIHSNTLYERCEKDLNITFVTFKNKNREIGNNMLHEKQFDLAYEDKDRGMLVWLGKQRLNQKDNQAIEHSGEIKTIEKKTVIFKNCRKKERNTDE